MSNFINPQLISLLVCPLCKGDLVETECQLECCSCNKKYEIRQGIPILYPPNIDIEHLRGEENLARMMKSQDNTRKGQFSLRQWDFSKGEFWRNVKDNVEVPPKSFINIGCGYDSNFTHFEQQGYMFINFDVVHDMLYSLQQDFGAKSCVTGDISNLPFKKKSFDYVVCIDVIHHESDKTFAILESFRDLLKPGGVLFLEDPNAWGMFQIAKSVLLPKPIYKSLRATYHKFKCSTHRPADYEFPTSIWRVKSILERLNFHNIIIYPNNAYPCIGESSYRIYEFFKNVEFITKYHNYHYMLKATKHID